jgi:hypothetical protein
VRRRNDAELRPHRPVIAHGILTYPSSTRIYARTNPLRAALAEALWVRLCLRLANRDEHLPASGTRFWRKLAHSTHARSAPRRHGPCRKGRYEFSHV